MEKLAKQLLDLEKSIKRVKEVLQKTENNRKSVDYCFFRDASIQRFEFTFEIFWKTIKTYLLVNEGIDSHSPKNCMREYCSIKNLDESDLNQLLLMVDDRNLTSHTYHEEIAEQIYKKLDIFIKLMEKIYLQIK